MKFSSAVSSSLLTLDLPPSVMVAPPPADDADRAGEAEPSGPEVGMQAGGDITEGVGL